MTQMRTESEALQEVIDKRKEALQAKADYYNYNKTISDKQKDINATYSDGVLTITLPIIDATKQSEEPTKIEIK